MRINAEQIFAPAFSEGKFCIETEKGVIKEVKNGFCSDALNAKNYFVAPGFVDVHIHGFAGSDISEGTKEALFKISEHLAKTGTANFLPTFVSMPFDELKRAVSSLTHLLNQAKGATPFGFHIEGGFVNKEVCGAMNPEHFIAPSLSKAEELTSSGNIRMFTVAPELPGAMEVIRYLSERSVFVSLGHTKTDFETAQKAFYGGASSVTHLFNAMPHFHHRNTGLIGAAFALPFFLQFIGDGVHTSKEVIKMVHLAKERLALITDCTEAGGMPEGHYMLGDFEIYSDGISARLKDGTLAGSVLTMDRGVRNLIRYGGFSREEAIRSATEIPALSVGETRMGVIKSGAYADFVLLDEGFNVRLTIVKGKVVYDAR